MASPAAWAQSSVQLYGIADAGLVSSRSGGTQGSVQQLSSGILAASRLGFKGQEDLGGGWSAGFNYEMGLDLDTGAAKVYSGMPDTATPAAPGGLSGTGFNRRSHLRLSGAFGELLLGRDYTPLFWTAVNGDPMKMGYFGNLQHVGYLSGTGIDRFGRVSNALFYTSPQFGNFQGRLVYSLGSESAGGGSAPPKDANALAAVGLDYKAHGLSVSAAYQEIKLPQVAANAFTGVGTRKDSIVSAAYTGASFSVHAGYLHIQQPVARSSGSDVWLGGTLLVGPGTVYALVQRVRQESVAGTREAKVYALAYGHPLSKRTTLYASAGLNKNNALASFGLLAADASIASGGPGSSVSAVGVGIRHLF